MTNSTVFEGFSFGQVVRLSGVKARTLDHWAATNFLAPSIKKAAGTGTKRVYSFSDVVAARVARDLRSAGASLQGLRKAVKEIRKREFTHPLAETRLIVSGKDVQLKTNEGVISMLRYSGQALLPFTVMDLGGTVEALRIQAEKVKDLRPLKAGEQRLTETPGARKPVRSAEGQRVWMRTGGSKGGA
jgi:DNA-binding transcriptional MerR regulator